MNLIHVLHKDTTPDTRKTLCGVEGQEHLITYPVSITTSGVPEWADHITMVPTCPVCVSKALSDTTQLYVSRDSPSVEK